MPDTQDFDMDQLLPLLMKQKQDSDLQGQHNAAAKFLGNAVAPGLTSYLTESSPKQPNIPSDYVGKIPSQDGIDPNLVGAASDVVGWAVPEAKAALAAKAALGKMSLGIVPPSAAAILSTRIGSLPSGFEDQLLKQGAEFTPEGINLNVSRWQKPKQSGHPALSQGVIYALKNSDPNLLKAYEGTNMWGGDQLVTGNTLIKNPLLVQGEWNDSLGYQGARDLFGLKGSMDIRNAAVRAADEATTGRNPSSKLINKFIDKYAPGGNIPPFDIFHNSGDKNNAFNRLGLWLQESAVAHEARNRGYDSILDYGPSKVYGKGWEEPKQMNQLFDLRESHYPDPQGGYKLWPQYQSIVDQLKK